MSEEELTTPVANLSEDDFLDVQDFTKEEFLEMLETICLLKEADQKGIQLPLLARTTVAHLASSMIASWLSLRIMTASTVPVFNGMSSACMHPTQALCDVFRRCYEGRLPLGMTALIGCREG